MLKKQLECILKTENPLDILKKSESELTEMFGSDFATMKDFKQNNPHHCYNLLEHILRTVCGLDCTGLSEEEQLELKTAALFHDIGKPKVAFMKKGRMVFYNHAVESEKISRDILSNMGYGGNELNRICFYIKHHDEFISYKLFEEITDVSNPNIFAISKETVLPRIAKVRKNYEDNNEFVPSMHDFRLLTRLCMADAKAQNPTVIMDGKIIDLTERKVGRYEKILEIIESADM